MKGSYSQKSSLDDSSSYQQVSAALLAEIALPTDSSAEDCDQAHFLSRDSGLAMKTLL